MEWRREMPEMELRREVALLGLPLTLTPIKINEKNLFDESRRNMTEQPTATDNKISPLPSPFPPPLGYYSHPLSLPPIIIFFLLAFHFFFLFTRVSFSFISLCISLFFISFQHIISLFRLSNFFFFPFGDFFFPSLIPSLRLPLFFSLYSPPFLLLSLFQLPFLPLPNPQTLSFFLQLLLSPVLSLSHCSFSPSLIFFISLRPPFLYPTILPFLYSPLLQPSFVPLTIS